MEELNNYKNNTNKCHCFVNTRANAYTYDTYIHTYIHMNHVRIECINNFIEIIQSGKKQLITDRLKRLKSK